MSSLGDGHPTSVSEAMAPTREIRQERTRCDNLAIRSATGHFRIEKQRIQIVDHVAVAPYRIVFDRVPSFAAVDDHTDPIRPDTVDVVIIARQDVSRLEWRSEWATIQPGGWSHGHVH